MSNLAFRGSPVEESVLKRRCRLARDKGYIIVEKTIRLLRKNFSQGLTQIASVPGASRDDTRTSIFVEFVGEWTIDCTDSRVIRIHPADYVSSSNGVASITQPRLINISRV